MTVRKMISELKKMPQNAIVATAAHDNGELEIQGFINDYIELRDWDKVREKNPNDLDDQGHKGIMVILGH